MQAVSRGDTMAGILSRISKVSHKHSSNSCKIQCIQLFPCSLKNISVEMWGHVGSVYHLMSPRSSPPLLALSRRCTKIPGRWILSLVALPSVPSTQGAMHGHLEDDGLPVRFEEQECRKSMACPGSLAPLLEQNVMLSEFLKGPFHHFLH